MDDNFVWCALIFALAYVGRNMLPSYYELTKAKHGRIDAINDALDDNEQTMLAMEKKLQDLQSDVAGHLTRLDDFEVALGYVAMANGIRPPVEEKL